MLFENSVNIQGRAQGSITTGTQTAAKLSPGVYDVWSTSDVYIKVNSTLASDVTTGTGYLVRANTTIPVQIPSDAYLGVVSGTLVYHQVA